ncbi:MAG: hypothetical protein A2Z16_13300 [Chloroflexi bacterium RBG_16_54_18]|nr:MAG: hypothetical protein A2Z16_13300 [Chloroflexi bacterium RBG_16_54_18]
MTPEHYYAVIMAGGSGTRLWPLSRQTRPKQMLSLFDERSLFQTAVQRLNGVFPPERIYIVTVREQSDELRLQAPEIPEKNFLMEPLPRGTASVVGLAAAVIGLKDPDGIMAVLGSDHFIGNEPQFRDLLQAAQAAAAEGFLVTLGIEPNFPAIGFGYIQLGESVGSYKGLEAYKVVRFTEKPHLEQAKRMVSEKGHVWNSGMFVWKISQILTEFEHQMPELSGSIARIQAQWLSSKRDAVLEVEWDGLETQTIDYGIMEHAEDVVVIPAPDLKWSDVGSWDSLFDVLAGDEHGNIIIGGAHLGLDTNKSLVYTAKEHRLIVTIGVDNLVVVDTGDVLLVCHKDQAQRIRQIVNQLKQDGQIYL